MIDHLNNPITVSIRCMAFNHEPYIRECLEGFINQKTNFRYEAIVHDDASTDNTAAIIKEYAERYPDIIKPLFEKENQYSKHDGSLRKLIDNEMRGKYIAFCEGDDYWTDPYKLQKQVDFLEQNPEYGLCCGKAKVLFQERHTFGEEKGNSSCEKYPDIILGYNDLNTATTLFRKELWMQCQEELRSRMPQDLIFDTSFWYWFACRSKIKFLDEALSVYRVLPESACHSKDTDKAIDYNLRFIKHKLLFLSRFPLEQEEDRVTAAEDIFKSIEELSSYAKNIGKDSIRSTGTYKVGKKVKKLTKWMTKRK